MDILQRLLKSLGFSPKKKRKIKQFLKILRENHREETQLRNLTNLMKETGFSFDFLHREIKASKAEDRYQCLARLTYLIGGIEEERLDQETLDAANAEGLLVGVNRKRKERFVKLLHERDDPTQINNTLRSSSNKYFDVEARTFQD